MFVLHMNCKKIVQGKHSNNIIFHISGYCTVLQDALDNVLMRVSRY